VRYATHYQSRQFDISQSIQLDSLRSPAAPLRSFAAGNISDKPVIFVTYKLTHLETTSYISFLSAIFFGVSDDDYATYDPSAGYEVYHLIR
jgi:hypothetical protein